MMLKGSGFAEAFEVIVKPMTFHEGSRIGKVIC
jgi:hypothetical protein